MTTTINAYTLINDDSLCFRVPLGTYQRAWEQMKIFVADSARGNRKARILRAKLGKMPTNSHFGYLERLQYDTEKDEAYYICGQDWNAEMAVLRNLFDQR